MENPIFNGPIVQRVRVGISEHTPRGFGFRDDDPEADEEAKQRTDLMFTIVAVGIGVYAARAIFLERRGAARVARRLLR